MVPHVEQERDEQSTLGLKSELLCRVKLVR